MVVVPDLVVAVADLVAEGGIAVNFLWANEVLLCLSGARVR
jgi:hypothetical protein